MPREEWHLEKPQCVAPLMAMRGRDERETQVHGNFKPDEQ
jgi:hypothetical protein